MTESDGVAEYDDKMDYKKLMLLILGLCLGVYFCIAGLVFFGQRSLLYFPTHKDKNRLGVGSFVPWVDGVGQFHGYRNSLGTASRAFMFFHGNGGEALDRSWVRQLAGPGTDVYLVEYPGYGGREGNLSEKAFFAAALAAYDALPDHQKRETYVIGESLGTGVACYLAAQRPVKKLALISPYSSVADVAVSRFPFLPVRLLLRDPFESVSHLTGVQVPLFVIHGEIDQIIPVAFGRALYQSYQGPKQMVELPGVGHNDIVGPLLRGELAGEFRSFLQ